MTPPSRRSGARRRHSLRGRLLRAMSFVLVTLVLSLVISTAAAIQLGGAMARILRENYLSVVACQEMNEALERLDSAVLFAAAGRDDIARPMFVKYRAAFDRALEREANNITLPGEAGLVHEIDTLYRVYVGEVERALASEREASADAYFGGLLAGFHVIKDRLATIRSVNQKSMESNEAEAKRIAERALALAIATTAVALGVAAWFVWRIPKSVVDPIVSLTQNARAIGEGRLDTVIAAPELAELRVLGEALARMQERLRVYRESSLGELLAAKDLSRATIASMLDPVIVFGADGDVLLSNEAAEAVFGGGARGADRGATAGPLEIPAPIRAVRDAVLSSAAAILPESLADALRWPTSAGEKYLLVRASPLRTSDTGGAGVIVVAQDVTRFRLIDALKSDVVATVSHELKTPLTSLRLATHMLLEESTGPLGSIQRELALTARTETERLQNTVNELLDLVRIERDAGALKRTLVDPNALLDEVAAAHRTFAETKQIGIALESARGRSRVELDPEQIAIVLGNLLSNAIRHSRPGGRVTLSAYDDGANSVFSVSDQGEGIAPEHLPRIFDRHWSLAGPNAKESRQGLGLAIAKEISGRHGGTLEVESALGAGSTFRLLIPQPDTLTNTGEPRSV